MPASSEQPRLAVNRKARRDYHVIERLEAGIALLGTEVKAVRQAGVGFSGAFVRVENGEAVLLNLNIPPYEQGNRFNHEPTRPRRLLLHKREIRRIEADSEQKGLSLIPLALYLKHGRVKIELGVCRGKRQYDKRETLRRKTADRETARAMKRR